MRAGFAGDHRPAPRVVIVAAVSVLAILGAAFLVVNSRDEDHTATTANATAPTGTAAPPVTSTTTATSAVTTPTTTPATSTPPTTPPIGAGYALLWPYATRTEAEAWQESYRDGGHQPWHLDPGLTALAFVDGLLHFDEIDTVVDSTLDASGAHVTVGFLDPNGTPVRSAVVHLVHITEGDDAPWEVVGTDDTTSFTFTEPAYGATTRTPIAVGGRITGVDESIHVQAFQLGSEIAVGDAPAIPAGGENSPWSTTIEVEAARGATVTLAASTGGHLAQVERFTVTAVRLG